MNSKFTFVAAQPGFYVLTFWAKEDGTPMYDKHPVIAWAIKSQDSSKDDPVFLSEGFGLPITAWDGIHYPLDGHALSGPSGVIDRQCNQVMTENEWFKFRTKQWEEQEQSDQ
jgi:hypothetical protein